MQQWRKCSGLGLWRQVAWKGPVAPHLQVDVRRVEVGGEAGEGVDEVLARVGARHRERQLRPRHDDRLLKARLHAHTHICLAGTAASTRRAPRAAARRGDRAVAWLACRRSGRRMHLVQAPGRLGKRRNACEHSECSWYDGCGCRSTQHTAKPTAVSRRLSRRGGQGARA